MTREELQEYISQCPYDAFGDFSSLLDEDLRESDREEDDGDGD